MRVLLFLVCWIPLILFAAEIQTVEKPSITFLKTQFRLVDFRKDGVKYIEEYLPQSAVWEDYSKSLTRYEYFSVVDFEAAAQSKIWDFQEKVGEFPYELKVDKEKKIATLNAAYWWEPRPGALEKRALIFILNPTSSKSNVVAYEYLERHFVKPAKESYDALKAADKSLLLDEKILEALKNLSAQQG